MESIEGMVLRAWFYLVLLGFTGAQVSGGGKMSALKGLELVLGW
jgi:hypothetical protein